MAIDRNPRGTAGRYAALIAIVGSGAAATLISLVPEHEGTIYRTYRDPVGIVTACTGHTGPELKMGQTFTPGECADMLATDLTKHARGVQDCIRVPMTDGELAAWTSFAFNVGAHAFCTSTAARKLNAGNRFGACAELSRWTLAKGQRLPGLVRRRAAERALCESGLSAQVAPGVRG